MALSRCFDQLRDWFKIANAGQTTFVTLLNSLQMSFRALAL